MTHALSSEMLIQKVYLWVFVQKISQQNLVGYKAGAYPWFHHMERLRICHSCWTGHLPNIVRGTHLQLSRLRQEFCFKTYRMEIWTPSSVIGQTLYSSGLCVCGSRTRPAIKYFNRIYMMAMYVYEFGLTYWCITFFAQKWLGLSVNWTNYFGLWHCHTQGIRWQTVMGVWRR